MRVRRKVGEAGEMCESKERSGRGWKMVGRMGEKLEDGERWERVGEKLERVERSGRERVSSGRGWREMEEGAEKWLRVGEK